MKLWGSVQAAMSAAEFVAARTVAKSIMAAKKVDDRIVTPEKAETIRIIGESIGELIAAGCVMALQESAKKINQKADIEKMVDVVEKLSQANAYC